MFKEIPRACFLPAHFHEDALLTLCRGSTRVLIKLWAPSFTTPPALQGACLPRAQRPLCAALLPSFSLQPLALGCAPGKSRAESTSTLPRSHARIHVRSQQTANITFRRNTSNESEMKTCQNPPCPKRSQSAHQGVIKAISLLLPVAHKGMADSQHIHQPLTP